MSVNQIAPINEDGSILMRRSPNTAPSIEYYLTLNLADVTIVSNAIKKDNQITLAPGHGFIDPVNSEVKGSFIQISYVDLSSGIVRLYQGEVVSVTGDVIGLSKPLDFDLDILNIESSARVTNNLASIGATPNAPIRFTLTPPDGMTFNLTRYIFSAISTSSLDDAKFIGGAPLNNGLVFGFESDLELFYGFVIRDNSDARITGYDMQYISRSGGSGSYGAAGRKTSSGEDKSDTAIRLEGVTNDHFFIEVQDDLTAVAGLEYLAFKVDGNIQL